MAATRSRQQWLRVALAVLALIAFMYLVWEAYDHQRVVAWLQSLPPLPFFIAMSLLPAIGVPTTSLYILAGASLGIPLGLVVSLSALAVNSALCFWIARWMRPTFERLLRRFKTELPDFSERKQGAARFVLGVKLAPGAPAFAKNYALGMSGVSFRLFMTVTMLVTGLYAAAFVVIGESLLTHKPSRALITILVLAALVGLAVWYRRRRQRPGTPQRSEDGTWVASRTFS
jgi:uncharacterized membrane protein YdjX (TVP38/TMEM64 family)